MANFALTTASNPTAVIQSLNYALATAAGNTLSVSGNAIVYNNGSAYSYLYQWLWVAYSTSPTGTTGFSFSPTGATYYGVHSSSVPTPSSNPADYTWTQVANGGFGTTNFLWYITYGGGQVNFSIGPTAPNSQYLQVQDGVPVDLYIVTAISANVANGAPGSNGTTSTVNPSITIFPQNSNGSYTPVSEIITAQFFANTGNVANIATANVYANVSSTGNVSYSLIYKDPSINISAITSNTYNAVTLNFIQSTSGASTTAVAYTLLNGNTGGNGSPGTNGNNGVSSTYVTVYTQSNVIPSTPQTNTGAWNFGNISASVPPTDPNAALAQYSYIQPSTITLANANVYVQHLTNTISQTSTTTGYTYHTFYANTYMYGPNPQFRADAYSSAFGAPATAFWGNLTVSGATAYVDLLLVGAGGDGTNGIYHPTYPGQMSGGSGGNVTIVSNLALVPGTYTFQLGRGAPTAFSNVNTYSNYIYATQGTPGIINGNANIVAGYGGGINGSIGNAGTYYTPGSNDSTGNYYGGNGVADPWNQITWIGQQSGGTAYFGGGGSGGTVYRTPATPGGLGGGGAGESGTGGTQATRPVDGYAGGGAGGGTADPITHPTTGYGYNAYGSPGVLVIRQHNALSLPNGISTWSFTNPGPTLLAEVFSSAALAVAPQSNPTANVTNLSWSSPIVSTSIAPPSLSVTYPNGQYVINNQGVYTPTPVANVVTLTANIQAKRGNVIIAAVNQDTKYFTANGGYSISSNTSTAYNANVLVFGTPVTSTYNLYQTVAYGDVGGNVSGFISEALLLTTQGNTGPRGFTPMSYIVANVDPTTANTTILNAMFTAPRTNPVPPIGNGYGPLAQDVAQFFYPNVSAYGGGITAVYEYDGTNWVNVNGQVISGNLVATGTITTSQLNANEVWTLQLASTNATFGSPSSAGFWMASQNGDARFAGNTSIGANLQVGINANIAGNATIGSNAAIGNNLTIGNNARIGNSLVVANNATIGSNLVVGSNATIGQNLIVGDNATINQNLTIGDNAIIGGNLTIYGLVNGGHLTANTVSNTNIIHQTIELSNLNANVVTALNSTLGPTVYVNDYSLSSTADYTFNATYGYLKNLAYTIYTPTAQQYNYGLTGNGIGINITYSFDAVWSGHTSTAPALYLYLNTASGGGENNINFGTTSQLYLLSPSGQDIYTFAANTGNSHVAYGGRHTLTTSNTFPLVTSLGNFATFGLVFQNPNASGTYTFSNFNWSAVYC